VPFADVEVGIKTVRDGVPGDHLPSHSRLLARDVGLRRARDKCEGGVARVEMSEMSNLVGHHRAAAAGMVGPAEHPGLVEGAVDDQLTAAFEQVAQARLAFGPLELVLLLHGHPRHPPTLGGQCVTGVS
jgi:hypothetical protein